MSELRLLHHALINTSNSNTSSPADLLWSLNQSISTLRFLLFLILCIPFGLINLLCFVTIWTTRNLQNGAGILIGHMLLVEAIMCLLLYPTSAVFGFVHLRSVPTCRVFVYFFATVNNVGYYSILLLAVNRFVAINLPLRYHKFSTPKWNAVLMLTGWAICLVLNIPMEFIDGVGHYGVHPVLGGCIAEVLRPKQTDFRTVHSYLAIYFPFAMTGILYSGILVKHFLRSNRAVSPTSDGEAGIVKRKVKIFWMLLVSYLFYAFFFLTYPVLVRAFPDIATRYPLLPQWMLVFVICGYFVHPMFLITMSADHRKSLKALLVQRFQMPEQTR